MSEKFWPCVKVYGSCGSYAWHCLRWPTDGVDTQLWFDREQKKHAEATLPIKGKFVSECVAYESILD